MQQLISLYNAVNILQPRLNITYKSLYIHISYTIISYRVVAFLMERFPLKIIDYNLNITLAYMKYLIAY